MERLDHELLAVQQTDVDFITALLKHPASYGVTLFMILGVDALEDGRFRVWSTNDNGHGFQDEAIYDDARAAAEHFVRLRHERRLGRDYE